jgi:hypothetical protein
MKNYVWVLIGLGVIAVWYFVPLGVNPSNGQPNNTAAGTLSEVNSINTILAGIFGTETQ